MADLSDVIHREFERALAKHPGIKAATVTSYDSKTHRMKVKMQPDGVETGWMPVQTVHAGSGIGIVAGPAIGDQVIIGHIGGDIESPVHLGRLHSDNERPPEAQSGEVVIVASNYTLKFGKDGNLSISGSGDINITAGNLKLTGNLQVTGDVKASGGVFQHNSHDVGSTHLHTQVVHGGDQSGPPV